MISMKIKDDDIVLDEMIEGKDEEQQCIERIVTTCVNEWFLNIGFGLDYRKIEGKNVTDEDIRVAITEAIIQEDRVQEIDDISIERKRSERLVVIKVSTIMKSGNSVEVVRDWNTE